MLDHDDLMSILAGLTWALIFGLFVTGAFYAIQAGGYYLPVGAAAFLYASFIFIRGASKAWKGGWN